MIEFNNIKIDGDFVLLREKTIDGDKDFFIKTEYNVLNVAIDDFNFQVKDFTTIIVRIGLKNDIISIQFLRESDLQSNFLVFDVKAKEIKFKNKDNNCELILS